MEPDILDRWILNVKLSPNFFLNDQALDQLKGWVIDVKLRPKHLNDLNHIHFKVKVSKIATYYLVASADSIVCEFKAIKDRCKSNSFSELGKIWIEFACTIGP